MPKSPEVTFLIFFLQFVVGFHLDQLLYRQQAAAPAVQALTE